MFSVVSVLTFFAALVLVLGITLDLDTIHKNPERASAFQAIYFAAVLLLMAYSFRLYYVVTQADHPFFELANMT